MCQPNPNGNPKLLTLLTCGIDGTVTRRVNPTIYISRVYKRMNIAYLIKSNRIRILSCRIKISTHKERQTNKHMPQQKKVANIKRGNRGNPEASWWFVMHNKVFRSITKPHLAPEPDSQSRNIYRFPVGDYTHSCAPCYRRWTSLRFQSKTSPFRRIVISLTYLLKRITPRIDIPHSKSWTHT